MSGYPLPVVIEKDGTNEKAYDLYSRLLKDRIIFIGTEVEDGMSNAIIAQLLFLSSSGDDDIYMYINSPGGSVSAGLGIYDTMRYIKPDITTVCVGRAASMGCFLLSGGTKGKRLSLPHSRIMMHPISGGLKGSLPDAHREYEEMKEVNSILFELFAQNTGHTVDKVRKDFDRNTYMGPEEAQKYGIIDKIDTKQVVE